jgi:hypothetical protein
MHILICICIYWCSDGVGESSKAFTFATTNPPTPPRHTHSLSIVIMPAAHATGEGGKGDVPTERPGMTRKIVGCHSICSLSSLSRVRARSCKKHFYERLCKTLDTGSPSSWLKWDVAQSQGGTTIGTVSCGDRRVSLRAHLVACTMTAYCRQRSWRRLCCSYDQEADILFGSSRKSRMTLKARFLSFGKVSWVPGMWTLTWRPC